MHTVKEVLIGNAGLKGCVSKRSALQGPVHRL